MRKILILVLPIILAATTSFGQSKSYDLESFTNISMGISGDLYLKQGNRQSVEVRGDEDDIEDLEVEVDGDRLKIRYEGNSWGWNSSRSNIDVYITVPTIEGISLSGSGAIIGKSKITSKNLRLSVSGSGDMELDIETEELDISISGSGDLELKGSSTLTDLSISGSGEIGGLDFATDKLDARISGSGHAEITVNESIQASISGSGKIYYDGNPSHVNSHSSGSGKIKKI